MSLARRPEVGFDAEMDLDAVAAEPAAAPLSEDRRLVDFGQAQHASEECALPIFGAGRTGQLHMVDHRAAPSLLSLS